MATKDVFLTGKCKWAKLTVPDAKFGDPKWSIVLYLNQPSYEQFMELKKAPGGVKNVVKKDEDGYYVTLSRPTQRNYKGQIKAFIPPVVLDGRTKLEDGSFPPLTEYIGNGSDVTVKCEYYSYLMQATKTTEHAIRLVSVRVDNLVPYAPKRDDTPERAEASAGMDKQPQPLF
jgi:hypothetical protein